MDSVQEKKQFEDQAERDFRLLSQVAEIYDPKFIVETLQKCSGFSWDRDRLKKVLNKSENANLTTPDAEALEELLPKPFQTEGHEFRFIDLFAGIGGIRRGFEEIGGKCVFTSEWNKYAVRTYKANHYNDPSEHVFNQDIREVTLSDNLDIEEEEAYRHIDQHIPDHDVLLAGFPCQPFSLAGVSKKNSLGRKHGFECDTQGTLFFDVARILKAKRPAAFLLENVKNLKSHDKGKTFKVILETLDELGYEVADVNFDGTSDPKVIDARHYVPQHRERIVLVGFRRDLNVHEGFTLKNIERPLNVPKFGDILEPEEEVDDKYILTPKLWKYLFDYAAKHREKGNGFGFGLTGPEDVARTLSARYHKDGSEILVDRGWDMSTGFEDILNQANRPRRLTPKECARLMGFDRPNESNFKVPVSDTQAYRQFGNSVAVPVFRAVAKLMRPRILEATKKLEKRDSKAA
jgi:DNA (cytosine-5)-methyltransferase 1